MGRSVKVLPCPKQQITSCGGKYYFDQRPVDHYLWFCSNLKHTKSPWTGQKFVPMPWFVQDVISPLFGWRRKDDGTRRFRRVYLGIPKKNAKSANASALALYFFMADGEFGAEVYAAANERGQAGIVFEESKAQIKYSPLKRIIIPNPIKPTTKKLFFPATNSFYTTLSKDSSTKDGMSISCLVFDELHALRDRSLYSVLTQGSGAARRQPVQITITTAGYDRTSVCFEEYTAAKNVIKDETFDEELLGVIYEADEKDDWTDPAVWAKANPSLGITLNLRDLEHDCKLAQKKPGIQNDYKRLRLNLWTSQLTRWINRSQWDACARQYDLEPFRGLPCYGGLDLSSKLDLTAFVLSFLKENGVYLWPYLFMPEDRIEENSKRDKVPYDRWVNEGHLFATPGNTVDYNFILGKIDEAKALFDLQSIQFDPWNCGSVASDCASRNIKMIPIAQGYAGMSEPCKEFERLIVANRIYHPNNPVLNWNVDNAEVRTGPNGVIALNKPAEKAGQQKRIDGAVGSVLSIERIARGDKPKKSVYETRGVRFF